MGISFQGPEIAHIDHALASKSSHAPEIVLMQLEVSHEANLAAAQSARRHQCLVALKPSPLLPGKTLSTACQLLEFVDLLWLNEGEAITLLHSLAPDRCSGLTNPSVCVTVGDAELIAKARAPVLNPARCAEVMLR